MYTALIFQAGISTLSLDHKRDFLESADTVLIETHHLCLPSSGFCVFHIHTVDLCCKKRRLITAGASADELADEARRHGFTTMRERCRDLVLHGETTAEEAARTISSTIES